MKIRLVDQTEYDVVRNDIVNGCLEIEMENKTAEEMQTIFSNASNLSHIDLIANDDKVYGEFDNWTKYGGVLLNGDSCVAMLTQPADVTEKRLTTAESNALSAVTVANAASDTVSDLTTQVSSLSGTVSDMTSTVDTTSENVSTLQQNVSKISFDSEKVDASYVFAKAQAQTLSDNDALKAKTLYDEWQTLVDANYTADIAGFKFVHTKEGETVLYKTAQASFNFQGQWEPGTQGTESIFTRIDETHAGTQEDPIPYNKNMELFEGKYYTQNDVLYLCIRDSGIAMQYDLANLVSGGFVQVVS